MLTADFDVKLKLIILLVVGLVVLASVVGYLWHRDHHYSQSFAGVFGVMVVQAFVLVSLLLIHQ
ncbi:hypothetical protein [Levilactobacillus wangkuiensis]|uniref:hypothetical protein n=1 Tax=Levilactobacillus wangkuiensis TaxID=2799566 RepID=UPI00194548AD|nr:hypothetical protein [Levilactobacillus wangkuiensis]